MSERPLFETLEDLRSAREDLLRSSHQTFDGILDRYIALLERDTVLGEILESLLPQVDVQTFWEEGVKTMGGMVGSGKLAWPKDKRERVAMQRALLLGIARGKPKINEVTYVFFHSGNNFEGHQRQFVTQVVEPFQRDMVALVNPYLQAEKSALPHAIPARDAPTPTTVSAPFVSSDRIAMFRDLDPKVSLDLRKLIRLCEELNLAQGNRAWFSVASLTRTLMNHVPPALGQDTFAQVAAQATPKAFKNASEDLERFGRSVADVHLHEVMSSHTSLPTGTQVDLAQKLDIVLGEVERALAKRAAAEKNTP